MSRYGVFTGPNTGNYGPEKTPYLDTFHAVDDPSKVYSGPVEYQWWSILSCENRSFSQGTVFPQQGSIIDNLRLCPLCNQNATENLLTETYGCLNSLFEYYSVWKTQKLCQREKYLSKLSTNSTSIMFLRKFIRINLKILKTYNHSKSSNKYKHCINYMHIMYKYIYIV